MVLQWQDLGVSATVLPPETGSLVLGAANQLQYQKHVNSVVTLIIGMPLWIIMLQMEK